jgi:AcrR family transcriptional regulator
MIDSTHPGSGRAAATRRKIVAAAERLFAERGIHSVSLAEINLASEQRNRNAVQYHFGNKRALMQAIFDKHAPAIARQRRQILDGIESSSSFSLDDLVSALVLPVAEKLNDRDGGEAYVQINAQLAFSNSLRFHHAGESDRDQNAELRLAGLLQQRLKHLDESVLELRLALAVDLMFHALADHAELRNQSDDNRPLTHTPLVVSQLIDSITALLETPPSDRSRELLRDYLRHKDTPSP